MAIPLNKLSQLLSISHVFVLSTIKVDAELLIYTTWKQIIIVTIIIIIPFMYVVTWNIINVSFNFFLFCCCCCCLLPTKFSSLVNIIITTWTIIYTTTAVSIWVDSPYFNFISLWLHEFIYFKLYFLNITTSQFLSLLPKSALSGFRIIIIVIFFCSLLLFNRRRRILSHSCFCFSVLLYRF